MSKLQVCQKEKLKEWEELNHNNLKKNQLDNKDAHVSCMSLKYLQFYAWLLLALGLNILFTVLYISIIQNFGHITPKDETVEGRANVTFFGDIQERVRLFRLAESENDESFNKSERFFNLHDKIVRNLSHCQEDSCQIACAKVADIFTALHDVIKNSLCPSIDILLLERQSFPLGALENNWLPANIGFSEVIISFDNITSINEAAFDAHLFHNTFLLSLFNRHVLKIDSAALQGFKRLKHLTIKAHVKEFQACTLRPVQDTLLSFKLNGHLNINGTENVFDGSFLNNLTYLDLSHNIFNDSLSKMFLQSTPNLKYLIITQSQIQHIKADAFENLADKLLFLNLAKNRLSTLEAEVFVPVLVGEYKAVINLADNDWICDCQLKELAELYKSYSLQFMHVLYCKGPHHLYAVSLNEVNFDLELCLPTQKSPEENKPTTTTEEKSATSKKTTVKYPDSNNDITEYTTPLPFKLKMHCSDQDYNFSNKQSKDYKRQVRSSINEGLQMGFPAPDYEFDLELIAENNTVNVTIANTWETYLVIWFSEAQESLVVSYAEQNLDYECMRYDVPYLIVGPLQDNTTYTFCVLPSLKNDISPFNCLPLYVPPKSNQNVWISEENKHLTIGMLCLIFLLSTLAGALIAYFGINTYPDLLAGSKNILAFKKPNEDYVTTISETEYQRQASLKKHKPCEKQQSLKKLPLPETPPPDTSNTLCRISVKDLDRIPSVKSNMTFFDALPGYTFMADEYEKPKTCNYGYEVERRNIENSDCATPGTPPPLPKRNSNVSDSSITILSRLSKNQDVL